MIIDKHEVREICFKEHPLHKYLRFTEHSWYRLDTNTSFTALVAEHALQAEEAYQARLKKGTW